MKDDATILDDDRVMAVIFGVANGDASAMDKLVAYAKANANDVRSTLQDPLFGEYNLRYAFTSVLAQQ